MDRHEFAAWQRSRADAFGMDMLDSRKFEEREAGLQGREDARELQAKYGEYDPSEKVSPDESARRLQAAMEQDEGALAVQCSLANRENARNALHQISLGRYVVSEEYAERLRAKAGDDIHPQEPEPYDQHAMGLHD